VNGTFVPDCSSLKDVVNVLFAPPRTLDWPQPLTMGIPPTFACRSCCLSLMSLLREQVYYEAQGVRFAQKSK
jgi:hypothetical protein